MLSVGYVSQNAPNGDFGHSVRCGNFSYQRATNEGEDLGAVVVREPLSNLIRLGARKLGFWIIFSVYPKAKLIDRVLAILFLRTPLKIFAVVVQLIAVKMIHIRGKRLFGAEILCDQPVDRHMGKNTPTAKGDASISAIGHPPLQRLPALSTSIDAAHLAFVGHLVAKAVNLSPFFFDHNRIIGTRAHIQGVSHAGFCR